MFLDCRNYNYINSRLWEMQMMFGFLQNIFGTNSTNCPPPTSSGNISPHNSIFNGYNKVGNTLSDITVDSNLSCPNMFPNIGVNSAPTANNNLLVGDALSSIVETMSTATRTGSSLQSPSTSTIQSSTTNTQGANSEITSQKQQTDTVTNDSVTSSGKKIKLSANVINKVKDIAQKINCDYKDLIGVIQAESSWKPNKWNGRTAVGLIQFTQTCIDDLNQIYHLNLTKDKIAKMNIMQQLDLAEKSLIRAKKIAGYPTSHRLTASELYAINFYPQNAKRSYCVLRSGEKGFAGNRGLDLNGDGKITHEELASVVNEGRMQVIC